MVKKCHEELAHVSLNLNKQKYLDSNSNSLIKFEVLTLINHSIMTCECLFQDKFFSYCYIKALFLLLLMILV